MSKTIGWLVLAVVVGGGLGAFYYLWKKPEPQPETLELAKPPAAYEPQETVRHPIPDQQTGEEPQPLPDLNVSDQPVRRALADLYGEPTVTQYLIPDKIIRRFVITVDNLPREKVAVQTRPVKSLTGATVVVGDADADQTVTLSPQNYARYKQIVQLIQGTDAQKLSQLYFRLYPLFQQAYEELGYPGKYFNDRLVEAIDHLLETPDVQGDIKLVRPKVFFEYADPELEQRSAGQKLLIRMGPENAAAVKAKLKELRAQLVKKPQ